MPTTKMYLPTKLKSLQTAEECNQSYMLYIMLNNTKLHYHMQTIKEHGFPTTSVCHTDIGSRSTSTTTLQMTWMLSHQFQGPSNSYMTKYVMTWTCYNFVYKLRQ